MYQHLRRGMFVAILAIGRVIDSVILRSVRFSLDLRGEPSHDTTVNPNGEAFGARHHACKAPHAGVMVAATAALLATASCSGEPGTRSRPASPPIGSQPSSPTVTPSSPSPSDAGRFANIWRFSDAFDRFAYKSAYSDCRLIGVDGTAEAFGGDPDDPRSVARAYAVSTFPQSVEHREATFQGCLDGFETGAT
jgi:hypothetical protein